MHSSRMCTVRLLAVSPSMHCAWGVSALGGVCSGGGASAPRRCLLSGGVSDIPACTEADPPPMNRITDACENTTFPQLRLRAVIKAPVHKILDPPLECIVSLRSRISVIARTWLIVSLCLLFSASGD